MRRALPLTLAASLALSSTLFAQNDRFAYAITDLTKEGSSWNALRKLDLRTGQYSTVLFDGTRSETAMMSMGKKAPAVAGNDQYGGLLQQPFGTGVAAAAYDKKHNRLYFTPMFVDQLRYIDLKTMKVYAVNDQSFTKYGNMHNDEGRIVTRMVIDPNGNGYAITNDANLLIRFSTEKKTTKIEQLGALVDDPSNNGISVHNRCSSFGGDMISDDKGNLYIISARNQVFRVNTETKVATHLGMIKNLDPNFTINGAVVDGDGNLLVSSAVDGQAYYVVNPADWSASRYASASEIYRASDLANSNFLASPGKNNDVVYSPLEIQRLIRPEEKFAREIAVYPNPVTSNNISVQFNKVPAGNYTLELRDVLGRQVMQRMITISGENQVQTLSLNQRDAKGIYMVKVFDNMKQSVFTQKVVVQ